MPAYVIVDVQVHDPEGYAEYRQLSGASVAQYGGQFLVRGGAVEVAEGAHCAARGTDAPAQRYRSRVRGDGGANLAGAVRRPNPIY